MSDESPTLKIDDSWAKQCARCGKSVDADENRTINDEPALLHWNPIHEPGEDPTGMICPECQGMTYDWYSEPELGDDTDEPE